MRARAHHAAHTQPCASVAGRVLQINTQQCVPSLCRAQVVFSSSIMYNNYMTITQRRRLVQEKREHAERLQVRAHEHRRTHCTPCIHMRARPPARTCTRACLHARTHAPTRTHAHALSRPHAPTPQVVRDLGSAVTAKDEFLAVVGHELRTPLNAIIQLSRAIARGAGAASAGAARAAELGP